MKTVRLHLWLVVALWSPFVLVATPAAKPLSPTERAMHLLNRLAYGPRPGDVERLVRSGPKFASTWIEAQLKPDAIPDAALESKLAKLPSLAMDRLQLLHHYREVKDLAMAAGIAFDREEASEEEKKELRKRFEDQLPMRILEELQAQRLLRAVESRRQLEEMLFDFWWNHFNVDWGKGPVRWLATSYEREAIRRHLFGSFHDLLVATARHPAMLIYLDNQNSRGPNAKNPGSGGLNENYARELMELHTLGVDGGYSQRDVTELARILTGWSVESPREDPVFVFREGAHDRGAKQWLGHEFRDGLGMAEGEAALDILAHHPATAKFLARKLARFFVSDAPPESLVRKLAETFRRTGGDLPSVYRELFTSPEFWSRDAYRAKVKRPLQFVASSIRVLGGELDVKTALPKTLEALGEEPYRCAPPTGYRDDGGTWINPGALLERVGFALKLAANRVDGVFVLLPTGIPASEASAPLVRALAQRVLATPLSAGTERIVFHQLEEESRTFAEGELRPIRLAKATALVLGSPEFQRR